MADCAVCPKPVADSGYICHQCTAALATTLLHLAQLTDEFATTVARQDRIDRPTSIRPPQTGSATAPTPPLAGPVCAYEWCPHSSCRALRVWTQRPARNLLVRRPGSESALSPKALPVNLDAASNRDAVTTTLTLWAHHICDTRGVPVPAPPPPIVGPPCPAGWCPHTSCREVRTRPVDGPLAVLAKFVAAHLGWLRSRSEAPQAWADLARCHDRAVKTVDRPVPQWYAGPCWEPVRGDPDTLCRRDLYVDAEQEWITCPAPGCRKQHRVADRRAFLLEQARDHRAPAGDVARFVAAFAEPISTDFHNLLKTWIRRRLILDRGKDRAGRFVYRVGDVLDQIEQAATKRVGRRRPAASAVA